MPYIRIDDEPQAKGGWGAIFCILPLVICERVISCGILAIFVLYLEEAYQFEHDAAVIIVKLWSCLNGVLLFGGSFVSNKYLGRYRTMVWSSLSLIWGMLMLTITSKSTDFCSQKYREADNYCPMHSSLELGFSMCFVSVGTGGIVTCSTPFILDQFERTTDDGKTITTFCRWFHFCTTAVMIVGVNVITHIQINGSWTHGFQIYSSCIIVSVMLFFAGKKTYIHEKADERPTSLQEEEKKNFLRKIIPIWILGLCPLASILQQVTVTYFQAMKMNLYATADFKIRTTWIFPISLLVVGILLMIKDWILIPLFRTITGYQNERTMTMLQRMGIGMICSIVAMVVGGVVEKKRRDFALSHSDAVMSVFYLFPQLFLMGISMAYFLGGQLELFITESPQHMNNTTNAIFSSSFEIATFVNSYLFTSLHWITKNEERLDYDYYFIGGLLLLNFLCFLCYATRYQYKGSEDVGDARGEVAMLGRQEDN